MQLLVRVDGVEPRGACGHREDAVALAHVVAALRLLRRIGYAVEPHVLERLALLVIVVVLGAVGVEGEVVVVLVRIRIADGVVVGLVGVGDAVGPRVGVRLFALADDGLAHVADAVAVQVDREGHVGRHPGARREGRPGVDVGAGPVLAAVAEGDDRQLARGVVGAVVEARLGHPRVLRIAARRQAGALRRLLLHLGDGLLRLHGLRVVVVGADGVDRDGAVGARDGAVHEGVGGPGARHHEGDRGVGVLGVRVAAHDGEVGEHVLPVAAGERAAGAAAGLEEPVVEVFGVRERLPEGVQVGRVLGAVGLRRRAEAAELEVLDVPDEPRRDR